MHARIMLSGVALLLVTLPASVDAQFVPLPLVEEGDAVAGVGNVTSIDNLAVNDVGDWLVECDTDFPGTDQDAVLLGPGGLVLREDDPLPAPVGARINTFDSVTLDNAGNSGWNFFLSGTTGSSDDSGIYFNTTLVIQESDVSTAPEFTAGTPYVGFFETKINNPPGPSLPSHQIAMIATVDDAAIPTTVDQAVVVLDLDMAGGLLAERAVAKEADVLPGQVEAIEDFETGPHTFAFNDLGQVLFLADLTGATATDGLLYLHPTGKVAQEGDPAPVPLRNYEFLLGRGCDLNNHGDVVYKANLDGSTADDDVIIKNGLVIAQEGNTLPVISPFTLTSLGTASGPVAIDDSGDVLWYGEWSDPNPDVNSGLFLNGRLIVQEGVTTAGGITIDTINSGQDAFAISDNGKWIIFEATLVGGVNGAYMIQVPTSVPDQAAGPGALVQLSGAPNPFRGETRLRYQLPADRWIDLAVFDAAGRRVATLVKGPGTAGGHETVWNGRDAAGRALAPGIYYARLETGNERTSTRIVLLP
jgi:hypothetical protein